MILSRHVFLAFVTCLFFIKALIPAGYMPSFDRYGKIAVVICSLEGDKTVFVDADQALFSAEENHQPVEHFQNTCPYAVLAFAKIFVPPARIVFGTSAISDIDFQTRVASIWFDPSATPYHSRAPPVFIL